MEPNITSNPAGSPVIHDTTPGALTPNPPSEGDSEFDRFGDLTRKLVQIPKEEVDQKRKGEA